MSETIGRQTASYRQGLVLGLTMAEIMLLLVFCLLIAVGVVLADQRVKLGDAILHLKQAESAAAADKAMVETIRRNTRLTELLDRATGSASQREIDDFWRKLVESNDLVVNMERQGVSRVALKEESNDLARLHRLRNEGIDPDKIARGVALASAIDEAASAKTMPKLTPQQAAALIKRDRRVRPTERERPWWRAQLAADHQSERGRRILLRDRQRRFDAGVCARAAHDRGRSVAADRRVLRRRCHRGHRTYRRAARQQSSFQPRSQHAGGDLGTERPRAAAMGRQCRARACARTGGGQRIVRRPAAAYLSRPAALGRPTHRYRRRLTLGTDWVTCVSVGGSKSACEST